VVETIKKEGLKVVYAEEGFTHPVLNTLARDTGVKIGRAEYDGGPYARRS
jgi:ABC-type Zn uptake system ZnuABC Zn-binding protein ZnuA